LNFKIVHIGGDWRPIECAVGESLNNACGTDIIEYCSYYQSIWINLAHITYYLR